MTREARRSPEIATEGILRCRVLTFTSKTSAGRLRHQSTTRKEMIISARQEPTDYAGQDPLRDLDKRELARLHLRRLTPPSFGSTYWYGRSRQDINMLIMYPLD